MKLQLGLLAVSLVSYAIVASFLGSPEAGPGTHFVDITDATGIHFKHISAPEKKYIVESMRCSTTTMTAASTFTSPMPSL